MMGAMTSERAVRVVVHGRVQGVFFRDSCRQRASELGVRGWVRNRPDGTVEALLSGRSDDVDVLLSWIRVGPPQAVVTDVGVAVAEDPGGTGFEVR